MQRRGLELKLLVALVPNAFSDHESDVVVLFLCAELPKLIDNGLEQRLRW